MDGRRTANSRVNGRLLNDRHRRSSVKDEELSRLEDELKKAYVLKALQAQLTEQEADRLAAEEQSRIANEITSYQVNEAIESRDRQEESERQLRESELKAALERQLEEKRVQKAVLEEEERVERKMLLELDRLREERETREKALKKEQLGEHLMLESLLQQEIRTIDKQKLQELEVEEASRNKAYRMELDERAEKLKKRRLEALKKREEIVASVAKILLVMENDKEERHRLMLDLMLEEVKVDAELEARELELRRQRQRLELKEALEEQIRFEEECRRRFVERERQFAEAVMAKVMESERIERMTAQLRRQCRFRYREELEQLMAKRERARVEELARLRLALEEERKKELDERNEARMQRIQLLKGHVHHVADFLSVEKLYEHERNLVRDSLDNK